MRGTTVVKYPAEIVFLKIVFARLDTLLVSPLLVTALVHHLFSYIPFCFPDDDVGVSDYTASSTINAERSNVNASTELLSPYLPVESKKSTKNININGVAINIPTGHPLYTRLMFYRNINLFGVSLHPTNLGEMHKYETVRLLHSLNFRLLYLPEHFDFKHLKFIFTEILFHF